MTATVSMPTRPDFTTADPCPPYCNLTPGHPVDSIHDDGRQSRGHGGPAAEFGEHISCGSVEYVDQPGVYHPSVQIDPEHYEFTDPGEAIEFARYLVEACGWLVDQKKAGQA